MLDKAIWAAIGLLLLGLFLTISESVQNSRTRQTYEQSCTQRGGVVIDQRNAKPLCIDNKFLMEVK